MVLLCIVVLYIAILLKKLWTSLGFFYAVKDVYDDTTFYKIYLR